MEAREARADFKVRLWDSIPVRLALGVLLLTLVSVTLVLLTLARQEMRLVIERDAGYARGIAAITAVDLASRMLAGGESDVWSGLSSIASQYAGAIDALRILVLNKAGVVKAGSDSARLGQRIALVGNPECPGCESAREEDFPATALLSTPQGSHYLRVVNPVPVSLACLQCHAGVEEARSYVIIDFDLTPMERASQRRQMGILGTGLAVSLALVALITFLFRRLVMRPVDALIGVMGRLAGGDLSARTPVLARNELGLLARHFNHMAGQIEDQVVRIEAAHTESQLLYTLVVEASKSLETTDVAAGVCRVIREQLHPEHAVFFLETADGGWLCAATGAQEVETGEAGNETLETMLNANAAQAQGLLGVFPRQLVTDVCRTRTLRLLRDAGALSLVLPIIDEARLIGLLACAGIPAKIRIDEAMLNNLGAHLTLAVVNSRNYTGAVTDALTRLRNKRYGLIRLEEAVFAARRYKSGLALAMCDIDHFKRVNDTYGHPAGDAVLKEVSRRIAACVRKADVAVRYGGEEFMLILPEAGASSLLVIGEKIREAVAATPVGLGAAGGSLPITLSVGITAFHSDADSGETLIARADAALYRAKEGGRNRVEIER